MAILSTKDDVVEDGNIDFPCLMKGLETGAIVLFRSKNCGTVVNGTSNEGGVGSYREDWNMFRFEKFNGIVTLENE